MTNSAMTYGQALRRFQVELLSGALIAANGNACDAALALGIHRNTFDRILLEASGVTTARVRAHLKQQGLVRSKPGKAHKPHPRYRRAA